MRIACLLSEFPLPSETFILTQITGLIDRGCEVDIYADRPAEPLMVQPDVDAYGLWARVIYRPGVPESYVVRLFKALVLLAANLRRGPRPLLRSFNVFRYGREAATLRLFYASVACLGCRPYDVIHGHFGPNGLLGAMLRETGALAGGLITTFYGYDLAFYLRQARGRSYRFLFQSGDLFIAISETMRHQLIELGCPEERIIVHRLGVDLTRFHHDRLPDAPGGRVRIATVGRLVPKKGIDYALRAVARLMQAGYPIAYTIVGGGPLRPWIEARAGALGVDGAVELLGWRTQDDVTGILGRSDILLAPSITSDDGDQEGTPVAVMEAMAAGIPVVATCHSAIPEMVANGVSGLLVPERDPGALADALADLIRHPEARARMGESGRATVVSRHNLDVQNDGLVAIYRRLAAARVPGVRGMSEAASG